MRHDGDSHYHVMAKFYLANSSSNSSMNIVGYIEVLIRAHNALQLGPAALSGS